MSIHLGNNEYSSQQENGAGDGFVQNVVTVRNASQALGRINLQGLVP
jgi:hypothetical protein